MPEKLGILYDKNGTTQPSNEIAMRKFMIAARLNNFDPYLITLDDYYILREFKAVFVRLTTTLDKRLLAFIRFCETSGIALIDDERSIKVGSNKVHQYNIFKDKLSIPRTIITNKDNLLTPLVKIQGDLIVKEPCSSFSRGVYRCKDFYEYSAVTNMILEKGIDEFIVQEFIKSDYDWRIIVLNNKFLLGCKYYIIEDNFKVTKYFDDGTYIDGRSQCLPMQLIPPCVIHLALDASKLVGKGFYGVDIKVCDSIPYIIEINDNPSIDHGNEDALLGDAVYQKIMHHFRQLVDVKRVYAAR